MCIRDRSIAGVFWPTMTVRSPPGHWKAQITRSKPCNDKHTASETPTSSNLERFAIECTLSKDWRMLVFQCFLRFRLNFAVYIQLQSALKSSLYTKLPTH